MPQQLGNNYSIVDLVGVNWVRSGNSYNDSTRKNAIETEKKLAPKMLFCLNKSHFTHFSKFSAQEIMYIADK